MLYTCVSVTDVIKLRICNNLQVIIHNYTLHIWRELKLVWSYAQKKGETARPTPTQCYSWLLLGTTLLLIDVLLPGSGDRAPTTLLILLEEWFPPTSPLPLLLLLVLSLETGVFVVALDWESRVSLSCCCTLRMEATIPSPSSSCCKIYSHSSAGGGEIHSYASNLYISN